MKALPLGGAFLFYIASDHPVIKQEVKQKSTIFRFSEKVLTSTARADFGSGILTSFTKSNFFPTYSPLIEKHCV
jgi:hypothetical protein